MSSWLRTEPFYIQGLCLLSLVAAEARLGRHIRGTPSSFSLHVEVLTPRGSASKARTDLQGNRRQDLDVQRDLVVS
ncbi:hypothetical protein QBC39DRAFT_355225 [Podospora conica]|nr:hypothetical protein QBC39DRAFT_355225 [Schizothecium conicum]